MIFACDVYFDMVVDMNVVVGVEAEAEVVEEDVGVEFLV
jgi:hypothetical protein